MNEIAGSIMAGCASTLVGHPLDTIKVHQQTQPHMYKHSTLQVAKSLTRDNMFGLFRGIGPPMVNQIIMNTIMFSVFHKVKEACNDNENSILDENAAAMFAGLFSGFATACISTPTDWIKIQAQLNHQGGGTINHYGRIAGNGAGTSLSILRQLFHDHRHRPIYAVRTLYRGHVANLAREGVFTMVYLGLYDRICSIIIQGGYLGHDTNNAMEKEETSLQHMSMGAVMMVSSFTGAFAWICNYPFDTIKTVMQGKEAGGTSSSSSVSTSSTSASMRTAFRSIWESGGMKAFFRGVEASTFRAMLVTSIRMLAYEKTKQLLEG